MTKEAVSVRVDARSYAYLRASALGSGKSITAKLESIIGDLIKASPITFIVRRCIVKGDEFHRAALGEGSDDFFDRGTEDEAYEATLAKIKELGLILREVDIVHRTETFVVPDGRVAQ